MGRLRIQHCILAMTVRQYGPHPTSDLLGVDFIYAVPADAEFPRTIGRCELFVRFFGTDIRRTRLRVAVTYLNPDGTDRLLVYRRPFVLPQQPPGTVSVDRGFKMVNVRLPGEGLYAVRLLRRRRRAWAAANRWRVMGTDYLSVMRAP